MAEAEKPLRTYFVHVELALATPARVTEAGKAARSALSSICRGGMTVAHTSIGLDQFGYFIATRMTAGQIINVLNSPRGRETPSVLRSGDKALVVDVGRDSYSVGKDEAARWLQHH